jgi:uncharacterized protein (DUF1810 family)
MSGEYDLERFIDAQHSGLSRALSEIKAEEKRVTGCGTSFRSC